MDPAIINKMITDLVNVLQPLADKDPNLKIGKVTAEMFNELLADGKQVLSDNPIVQNMEPTTEDSILKDCLEKLTVLKVALEARCGW